MAGKGGRTAAVVGWCLLLLSLTAPATAQGAPSMTVSYPEEGNYSHVNLTCVGNLGDMLTIATFAREDSDIMEGSDDVVSMVDIKGATVEFVFDQSQEGAFSCESNGLRSSAEVLAGTYASSSVTVGLFAAFSVVSYLCARCRSGTSLSMRSPLN